MLTAPLINLALTFPEFEEQFNGPALSQQDDRFPDTQTFGWGIRQNQRPLRQLPLLSGHRSSMFARFLFQLLASLYNHFLRHTDSDQSQWELIWLTDTYADHFALSHFAWQDAQQRKAFGALPIPENGVALGTNAKIRLVLVQLDETLHAKIAEISHIQTSLGQGICFEGTVLVTDASCCQTWSP